MNYWVLIGFLKQVQNLKEVHQLAYDDQARNLLCLQLVLAQVWGARVLGITVLAKGMGTLLVQLCCVLVWPSVTQLESDMGSWLGLLCSASLAFCDSA